MRLGFRGLVVTNTPGPGDLYFRWTEQRYVYNGQNPNDVILRAAAIHYGQPLPECPRNDRVDPKLGPLHYGQGGYPPWSYFTSAFCIWPTSYQSARNFYAVLNALALLVILGWAYRIGRPHSIAGGVFLATAVLANYGNYNCLDRGQNAILVNALLVGVYCLIENHRQVLAGILYGLAAIKPQIVALYGVVFLVRRQWALLAAATAYVVLASVGTWALTKTDPVEMLRQMYRIALFWVDRSNSSLLNLLIRMGMAQELAAPLTAAVGLVACLVLVWLWRNGPTLTLFAVAATIGRLWTYHSNYDNVMLLFLLAALGKLVLDRISPWTVLAFAAVGVSLWIRIRVHPKLYPLPLQVAQMSSWLVGLGVLLAAEARGTNPEVESNVVESHRRGSAEEAAERRLETLARA
jgi:hypothetical protein